MRGWRPYALAGVAAGALVVVAVVLYLTVFTVSLTVAGQRVRLPAGTTVGDLWARGFITAPRGNLVSAREHVIVKARGGMPPVALVNSRPAPRAQELRGGDVVVAVSGADVREKVSTRTEAIPFETRNVGVGPVETIVATGSPGIIDVWYGTVSDEVVATSVAAVPITRVVRLSQPGPHAKLIALTFDDGPWPSQTRAILRILLANNVRATFFEIGQQAHARPSLSLAITRAGMLIGNHTETHNIHPQKESAAQVAAEINTAQRNITAASGQVPHYFRPPGGIQVPAMAPVIAKDKLKLVLWDIDPNDWKRPPTATIVKRVVSKARPGAVILMHDGGGNRSHTIAALPQIIKQLKAKGFVFVTLDALKVLPHHMG